MKVYPIPFSQSFGPIVSATAQAKRNKVPIEQVYLQKPIELPTTITTATREDNKIPIGKIIGVIVLVAVAIFILHQVDKKKEADKEKKRLLEI